MKKSELKTGMYLTFKSGEERIVLLDTENGDVTASYGSEFSDSDKLYNHFPLKYINEDLVCDSRGPIIQVCNAGGVSLWQRNQEITLTLNESAKATINKEGQTIKVLNEIIPFSATKELHTAITTVNVLPDMKFRVYSPSHSTAIQERLFKLGFRWSDEKRIKHLEATYLFSYTTLNNCLTCGASHESFSSHTNKETTLDDLYNLSTTKDVKLNSNITAEINKDTIKAGCQVISFDKVKELHKLITE